MLFVSDYDVITEPIRSLIITLQIIYVIGCILICLLILFAFKKRDPNIKKSYLLGLPLFALLLGLQRSFLIYHDYYASDNLDTPLIFFANSLILSALIILNFTLESTVYTKTHHLFLIMGVFLAVLYLIFLLFIKIISTIILYCAIFSQVLPIFGMYIYIARNGTGNVRKKAVVILIGVIILLISQSTGLFMLIGLMDRITSTLIAPPVSLVSLIILGYGFLKKA